MADDLLARELSGGSMWVVLGGKLIEGHERHDAGAVDVAYGWRDLRLLRLRAR